MPFVFRGNAWKKIVSCAHSTMQAGVLGSQGRPIHPYRLHQYSMLTDTKVAFGDALFILPSSPHFLLPLLRHGEKSRGRRGGEGGGGAGLEAQLDWKCLTKNRRQLSQKREGLHQLLIIKNNIVLHYIFQKRIFTLQLDLYPSVTALKRQSNTTVNEADIFKAELIKPSTGRDPVLLFSAVLELTLAAGSLGI